MPLSHILSWTTGILSVHLCIHPPYCCLLYAQDLKLPSDHMILLACHLPLHNQLTECLYSQILREESKMSSSFLVRSCIGLWLTNRLASSGSGVHCWFSHLRLKVELGLYDTVDSSFWELWHHETHLLQIILEISFVMALK